MNNVYRSIFLLKSFSCGLLMPVMSLMIMARGVTASSLALIVGIYSLTVIVLEFPSGVFCDLVGRKKTFLISCVFMLLSLLVILLFGKGTLVLSAAFIIQGAGRAFASGSLDALVIERSMEQGGDAAVARTSGELEVLECTGIAVGSLAGGVLGGIGSLYNVNLAVMVGIYILIIILVLTKVNESSGCHISGTATQISFTPDDACGSSNATANTILTNNNTPDSSDNSFNTESPDTIHHCTASTAQTPATSFRSQMMNSLRFSWSCLPIRQLMILTFFTGIVLFSVEVYWQPGLLRLLKTEKIWLMGFVSFLGFGLTALSSQLGGKLLEHFSKKDSRLWWHCLFLAKLLFGAAAALFGFWIHPALFICNYSLFYFIHGGGSVIENALLSKHTANEMRASVMSLFSLVFQFGGLTASALSGSLLANAALPVIWLMFGLSMMVCAMVTIFAKYKHSTH